MLKGKKIALRAMEPADIEPLLAWENNTDNWLNSDTHRPFSRHAIENHVLNATDVHTDKQLRLMITLNEEDHAIGAVDLFDCDFVNGRAGVGILIEKQTDRGKGHGLEALELLAEYAREVLLLHQLFAEIIASNEKSIHLFERAGFVECGRRRDWIKRPKGYLDTVLMQIVFDDHGA